MKNNLSSMALFLVCAGLSVHVCAMQQRRDCNTSIKKLAKVARVENEAKRALNEIQRFEDDFKNIFRDKKRADAVRQDQHATCPTWCVKNKQNTFVRLNALNNAPYFSPKGFGVIDRVIHERWHETCLPSASQQEIDLFEEKCMMLKEVIKKGMRAGYIQETEPDLSPVANVLRREIIEEQDGGVE